jgi:hypothetical protein
MEKIITKKDLKEENNININIIKEEYGTLINILGAGNHKTIFQQATFGAQQLLQIGEVLASKYSYRFVNL